MQMELAKLWKCKRWAQIEQILSIWVATTGSRNPPSRSVTQLYSFGDCANSNLSISQEDFYCLTICDRQRRQFRGQLRQLLLLCFNMPAYVKYRTPPLVWYAPVSFALVQFPSQFHRCMFSFLENQSFTFWPQLPKFQNFCNIPASQFCYLFHYLQNFKKTCTSFSNYCGR